MSSVQFLQTKFPGQTEQEYRSHLGSFGITGLTSLQKIGTLSGGQKSRVAFAVLSLQRPHILLLDEVSTDHTPPRPELIPPRSLQTTWISKVSMPSSKPSRHSRVVSSRSVTTSDSSQIRRISSGSVPRARLPSSWATLPSTRISLSTSCGPRTSRR